MTSDRRRHVSRGQVDVGTGPADSLQAECKRLLRLVVERTVVECAITPHGRCQSHDMAPEPCPVREARKRLDMPTYVIDMREPAGRPDWPFDGESDLRMTRANANDLRTERDQARAYIAKLRLEIDELHAKLAAQAEITSEQLRLAGEENKALRQELHGWKAAAEGFRAAVWGAMWPGETAGPSVDVIGSLRRLLEALRAEVPS